MINVQIIVQKYGGSLMKGNRNQKRIIEIVQNEINQGNKLILVVSAIGRDKDPYSTDTLLSYGTHLSKKELDRLISIGETFSSLMFTDQLLEQGVNCYCPSHLQLDILCDETYTNGQILKSEGNTISTLLNKYDVLVIGGFIGKTIQQEIITLGRGGSDLTAAILAHQVHADRLEIFKEVDGICTIDPKICHQYKNIEQLDYNQLNLIAKYGVKVIQDKAANLILKEKIPLVVRSFYNNQKTRINENQNKLEALSIIKKDSGFYIIGYISDEIKEIILNRFFEYEMKCYDDHIEVYSPNQKDLLFCHKILFE